MSSRTVIVRKVTGQDSAQVPFAQDEDMLEALAPDRADEPLRERVLPGARGRRQDFADPHAPDSLPEHVTVDAVAIAEQIGWRGLVREGVDDPLGGPGRGGLLGDGEVEDPPAMVGEHHKDEEHPQARRGHREEIEGDQVADVVGEERPPGLGGGEGRWGISRETVRSAASRPSVRSSPWIRGAPHRGFAAAIRETRVLISGPTEGRPPVGRPESVVQCSRKRRRCHRRTVSGVTITRACRHPAQTLASQPQKRRSVGRSLGRGTVRLYTAS